MLLLLCNAVGELIVWAFVQSCPVPVARFRPQSTSRKPNDGQMPVKIGPFVLDSAEPRSRPQTGRLRSGRWIFDTCSVI